MTRRMLALAAVSLAAVMVLAGCSSSEPEKPGRDNHSGTPGPQNTGISEVTTSWLSAVYSWQPVTDRSPTDALIRARQWATGTLADPNPPRVRTRANPEWQAWATSGDVITATIDQLEVIKLTPVTATASARVSQVALHEDGDSTPLPKLKVTVSLKQLESGHWKVADYRELPAN